MADPDTDTDMHDEEYDENADEDFNPEANAAEDAAASSEDDASTPVPAKKSKKRQANAGVDLDSGDEATIQERERKQKRKKKDSADENADESAGEGGLIRTRAQRLAEKAERKQNRKAAVGEVTVDVDKLWADLSIVPVGRTSLPNVAAGGANGVHEQNEENAPLDAADDVMVTITRRIAFAGQTTEVEEMVPRNSREAQRYLRDHPEVDRNSMMNDMVLTGLQRPLKRPSMFEPNPTGAVKGVPPERLRPRAPSRLDALMAQQRKRHAEKLTTVQKSALDWKGYVDKEGLGEELKEYRKSGARYLDREAFLDRAQGARDDAARAVRVS